MEKNVETAFRVTLQCLCMRIFIKCCNAFEDLVGPMSSPWLHLQFIFTDDLFSFTKYITVVILNKHQADFSRIRMKTAIRVKCTRGNKVWKNAAAKRRSLTPTNAYDILLINKAFYCLIKALQSTGWKNYCRDARLGRMLTEIKNIFFVIIQN